jgi:hypothetical protein
MRTKIVRSLALGSAAVLAPLTCLAQTSYVKTVPYSATWFPSVYVHTGTSVDIQLEPGDTLEEVSTSKGSGRTTIVGDPRWITAAVTSGPNGTLHVIVKPSSDLPDVQMLTIPTTRHEYHVLLSSGSGATTTYTLAFFDPARRVAAADPAPTSTPASRSVYLMYSCATMDSRHYRVAGDPRIPVAAVCDDGVRTFIFMGKSRPLVAAVPYRVDPGGHQDQILNPVFGTTPGADGSSMGEWVLDGVFDHMALVADSSRGQIRTNIDRVTP